jgi:hypothetical protein
MPLKIYFGKPTSSTKQQDFVLNCIFLSGIKQWQIMANQPDRPEVVERWNAHAPS